MNTLIAILIACSVLFYFASIIIVKIRKALKWLISCFDYTYIPRIKPKQVYEQPTINNDYHSSFKANPIIDDMVKQPHLLVAGATGSGKSVLLNSIIYKLLLDNQSQLILIDPKKVELYRYINTPQVIKYASDIEDIKDVLELVIEEMLKRFDTMQALNQRMYNGKDVYIVVDELADLLTVDKKHILPMLQRIAQLGRAARIHLFMATQRPTKDILSGQLKVNLDSRVALRCPTAQDSRNIIETRGAEKLPRYGQGYYLTPDTMQPTLIDITLTPEHEIENLTDYYEDQFSSTDSNLHNDYVIDYNCL